MVVWRCAAVAEGVRLWGQRETWVGTWDLGRGDASAHLVTVFMWLW